jgi:hypothetical protein
MQTGETVGIAAAWSPAAWVVGIYGGAGAGIGLKAFGTLGTYSTPAFVPQGVMTFETAVTQTGAVATHMASGATTAMQYIGATGGVLTVGGAAYEFIIHLPEGPPSPTVNPAAAALGMLAGNEIRRLENR